VTYTITVRRHERVGEHARERASRVGAERHDVLSIGGGGTEADGIITWDLGTLRAGESGQRQFAVTVDAGALDGTAIDATAEIDRDTTTFGALASQTTTVNGDGTLTMRMAAQPDPSRSGERIVYDLVLCNPGADEVTGLDLDIVMPNGLAFVVALDGATCSTGGCGAGGLVNWDLDTLAAHRCRTLQASIRDQFTTDAALMILEARLRADNRQTVMVQRTAGKDSTPSLSLALTEDRDPIAPGGVLTYTLTAANRNTSRTSPARRLRFVVPAGTAPRLCERRRHRGRRCRDVGTSRPWPQASDSTQRSSSPWIAGLPTAAPSSVKRS
jgi:hypothetical protein